MSTFPSTAWTAVSRARSGDDPGAREALAFLCAAYWRPLYSFARRLGNTTEDALDLTQGYFALLIEKDYLARRAAAGGPVSRVPSDVVPALSFQGTRPRAGAETRRRPGAAVDRRSRRRRDGTPTAARHPRSRSALRAAVGPHDSRAGDGSSPPGICAGRSRRPSSSSSKRYLTGSEPRVRYHEAAERLGTTEGAVKKMVHRLRRRYGQLLREEIGATVADPGEIDSELHHLLSAVRPWEPPAA